MQWATPLKFYGKIKIIKFLRVGVRRSFGIKIFQFPITYIIWPALPRRVLFISENGFHACFRYSKTQRRQDEPGGNRTEGYRNCASTTDGSTIFVSHLRQFSAFGIWVFSTGLYYRMNSPSLLPISSRIAAVPVAWA